ncbi:MAG: SLC13 family permease [Rhodospirillaceae bacterium]|nr:SLC13 family permease [Rhodospirillaceae bacterium]
MTEEQAQRPRLNFKTVCSLIIVLLAALLFMLPPPDGVSQTIMRAAGLTLFAIGFWATAIWPIGLTAIAFFFFAALFSVQPLAVIFSGFTSPALWLIFGGLAIGASVTHTGLGERLARSLTVRLGGSYLSVISGVALVCMVLGFVMPSSMGRIVLLVPIVIALAEKLGFGRGSKGQAGIILSAALITFTSAGTILPALVPGMTLAGLADSLYDIPMTYGGYLQLHFPVLGVLKCLFIIFVTTWLFGEPPNRDHLASEHKPLSIEERVLSLILIGALGLWISDFAHGISAAWVALGASVLIFIPRLKLVPTNALSEKIDYGSIFYVAAVLGLSVILSKTGLAALAGKSFLAVFPFSHGADMLNYGLLAAVSNFLPLVVTNPGVPAVLSPLAQEFAVSTGLPLETVLMTQVIGFTNVVLPYQASPIVIAMAMGGVKMIDGAKLTLSMTVIGFIFLIPINYIWWNFLGLIE